MNNKEKTRDKRIEKLFNEIGEVAGLSLDYSFISTENEIVGIFYDSKSVGIQMLDGYEVLVPKEGIAFLILTEQEFQNPDIQEFGEKLKQSYEGKKDLDE